MNNSSKLNQNFDKVKKVISDTISKSEVIEDPKHSIFTREWLLKINPKASIEQQIAALAHDIERAVTPRTRQKKGENYKNYKQRHAKRSALITENLLQKQSWNDKSIKNISKLIKNHETGGYKEANEIKDADSLAYFDYNINNYTKRHTSRKSKMKIKLMYERATPKVRKIINKMKFSQDIQKLINEALGRK
jgi:hypothetical protein